ncbi:MAG: NCS1 family nucleobase:cation symporter-1 [Saprospirales bacterium]|nr:NCS1 family nucleobase:cation symporter-1 [Saprospirales bacterium]
MNTADEKIVSLREDHSDSPLFSPDLAPVPESQRSWNTWHLAALWIGMAVCIPTYLLASYMIRSGLSWLETILIIGVANLVITIPMALNGHAGVKYGIPFPVLGRAAFGIRGIHAMALLRGLVACGWFGIQTWIGGLALYAIFNAVTGAEAAAGLSIGKFIGFAVFWVINLYFVWKGTESIKWLEQFSAPILLAGGLLLIYWGTVQTGSFGQVLDQSNKLATPTASLVYEGQETWMQLNPLTRKNESAFKAEEVQVLLAGETATDDAKWLPIQPNIKISDTRVSTASVAFRAEVEGKQVQSSTIQVKPQAAEQKGFFAKIWKYLLWLTAMVGFWATMSLSISDITRYAKSQRSQIAGQFLGLPATMMLFSFVGVFVTCAAMINFDDILIGEDAPWDPVSLMAKFDHPLVVVFAQFFMLIATLTTNIAANVIAPANAFSNLWPKKISFKTGGLITGIIGIAIFPWLLLDQISSLLLFVSGLLGPVLGIMLCDYYVIRRTQLDLDALYDEKGIFAYGGSGFNRAALLAFAVGVGLALVGYWVPQLQFLYTGSWFTGFIVSFVLYYLLMRRGRAHFKT